MKCFAAHYIYLGQGELIKNRMICVDANGSILSFEPFLEETASTIFHNGIFCAAFGMSGSSSLMTPSEARFFINEIREKHPQISIKDFLQNHTNDAALKVGSNPTLWCLDSLDLVNLLVSAETTVYSVFP